MPKEQPVLHGNLLKPIQYQLGDLSELGLAGGYAPRIDVDSFESSE